MPQKSTSSLRNKISQIILAIVAIFIGLYPLFYFFQSSFALLGNKNSALLASVLWSSAGSGLIKGTEYYSAHAPQPWKILSVTGSLQFYCYGLYGASCSRWQGRCSRISMPYNCLVYRHADVIHQHCKGADNQPPELDGLQLLSNVLLP